MNFLFCGGGVSQPSRLHRRGVYTGAAGRGHGNAHLPAGPVPGAVFSRSHPLAGLGAMPEERTRPGSVQN